MRAPYNEPLEVRNDDGGTSVSHLIRKRAIVGILVKAKFNYCWICILYKCTKFLLPTFHWIPLLVSSMVYILVSTFNCSRSIGASYFLIKHKRYSIYINFSNLIIQFLDFTDLSCWYFISLPKKQMISAMGPGKIQAFYRIPNKPSTTLFSKQPGVSHWLKE